MQFRLDKINARIFAERTHSLFRNLPGESVQRMFINVMGLEAVGVRDFRRRAALLEDDDKPAGNCRLAMTAE